jgi:hypothetical protein
MNTITAEKLLSGACRQLSLKVNTEKIKHMVRSRHQNAEEIII